MCRSTISVARGKLVVNNVTVDFDYAHDFAVSQNIASQSPRYVRNKVGRV